MGQQTISAGGPSATPPPVLASLVPSAVAPVILSAVNLRKSYDGLELLHGVSLDIHTGDLVCVIGPSGCGKSTLLRCLNPLEIPDSGRITIAGISIERATKLAPWTSVLSKAAFRLRGHVGMVFQSFNLFPDRTVLQNVMLAPMVVKHMPRHEAREHAEALLAKVGLTPFIDRHPAALSGGQQQRAAIARALAMKPEVMLYNEPNRRWIRPWSTRSSRSCATLITRA